MNVELIRRENRRFSLTPAGEYFYSHSKAILEQVDDLIREAKQLGENQELRLRIGYLRCYSGLELHQAIAEFSETYPEVEINIVNGTHEELYDMLRFGGVDLVLNDQRRAFSDLYTNFELMQCGCYVEISRHNPLSGQDYYQNTLGFGGSYLFADNLEEGRLMVVSNRGFLPIESVGTLPPEGVSVRRLPVFRNGRQIRRNFWCKQVALMQPVFYAIHPAGGCRACTSRHLPGNGQRTAYAVSWP